MTRSDLESILKRHGIVPFFIPANTESETIRVLTSVDLSDAQIAALFARRPYSRLPSCPFILTFDGKEFLMVDAPRQNAAR